jgi:phosphoenolpyruvate synthase/pyruvate phosphate dikinase
MADLLGGKGANLGEMTRLGLPVPEGFVVSTTACREYLADGQSPVRLSGEITAAIAQLEERGSPVRRRHCSPARFRALRRSTVDARDDGHGPQRRTCR